jgi:amidase
MTNDQNQLVGQTASVLAQLVRNGQVGAEQVVTAHLDRIAQVDAQIGAFQVVHGERALAEARALAGRGDLATLPLAGVPIAIKDNIPVAGEPMRVGSRATLDAPQAQDHEVVRRLKAAGAIVVGLTRVPELYIWGTTDSAYGVTLNPWRTDRTPGGSSGGSAAAVAAAMVPIAHGNDGMGSVRIPAACCGLVGIKPGAGTVPSAIGSSSWRGLEENGVLATTVADAALMLSAMAARPDFAATTLQGRTLRVAVSTKSPLAGTRVDPEMQAVTRRVGDLLMQAGHEMRSTTSPSPLSVANALIAWWAAAVADEVDAFDRRNLERRTRGHAAGRLVRWLGMARPASREAWRRLAWQFFADYDLLITPALATPPIGIGPWSWRSWLANLLANTRYAPFAAPWNFAGYPALTLPVDMHSSGLPMSVQLVAASGGEGLLLTVAHQIEAGMPHARHAPTLTPGTGI